MRIRMDIHASVDGSDLRGIFRVWIQEQGLYRALRFRLYDYRESSSIRLEITHNFDRFIDIHVSADPQDETANQEAEQLPVARKALMELMATLINQAMEGLESPAVEARKKKGLWAMASSEAVCDYHEPETVRAISAELFALPDTLIPDTDPQPITAH